MMNDFQFDPDDPRLTAYALDELDPAERASVEAALSKHPELRAVVDEVHTTAARLEAALKEETDEANDAMRVSSGMPSGTFLPARWRWQPPPGARSHHGVPIPERTPILVSLPSGAAPPHDEYGAINGRNSHHAARRILRFPQLYYIVGGLAAAGFAVVVALREPPRPAPPRKVYQVVELQSPRAETAVADAAANQPVVTLPSASEDSSVAGNLALLDQVRGPSAPAPVMLPTASTDEAARAAARDKVVSQPPTTFTPERMARGSVAPSVVVARGGSARLQFGGRENAAEASAPGAATATRGLTAGTGSVPLVPVDTGAATSGAVSGVVTLQPFVVAEKSGASGSVAASSVTLSASAVAPYSPTDLFPGPRRHPPGPEWPVPAPAVKHTTEAYAFVRDNDFVRAAHTPLSTFSVDVDTASYANLRRFIQQGRLPPADAVRIEELINYFPYRYAAPAAADRRSAAAPFAASLEVAAAPWAPANRLVRIGLKGREVATDSRPAANLVFLVDVSGSMNQPNKLPLVKESMRLLLGRLRSDDRVAIVTYAGQSGLALPSTPVSRSSEILDALDSLRPGGSTNGAMGITLAYDIAKANFTREGVNRVVLCTDGDFNVGVTSQGELVRLVEEKAKSGVFLTVLGFGMGNLKDATLESLADKGNGTYGYVDTRREAEKQLVEEMSGTLVTIARDVKIQVDFNPAKVASYRLIGYENRALKPEDFSHDKADAGEIGAGHTVTALYEIVPVDAANQPPVGEIEESKYQPRVARPPLPAAIANELLTVRVRYKEPDGEVSRKLEFPLTDPGTGFEGASPDFKFSSAVAAFGMILRDSPHKGGATINTVIDWAMAGSSGPADDPHGYRREFLDLARRVQGLLARG